MKQKPAWAKALCVVALMGLSANAAAEIKWTFKTGGVATGTSNGNSRQYSGNALGAPTVIGTAWSNTADGPSGANTVIQDAYLGSYSGGLGVTNRDPNAGDLGEGSSPEHSTDNNDRYDSVLFSFSQAIDVNKVEIGWRSTDSDITVLAYTGANVPVIADKTYSQLTSSGWTLVGHYANLATNTPMSVNDANLSSAYWIVGAYNPTVGGSAGWTIGDDYVKILALYGDNAPPPPHSTPEPSAAAMLVPGLLGIALTRRNLRRRRNQT
jgi:hypothetical protein